MEGQFLMSLDGVHWVGGSFDCRSRPCEWLSA